MSVSPSRACAYAVLRRVFEQGAFADRALQAESAGLEPRDRALAMAIAYGAVQRKATLDYVAGRLSSRPPADLDPPVQAALALGLFQLLFLDGVADHAAVYESVELVKRTGRGGASLVNAVLRRGAREGSAILAELDDDGPRAAALLHSVPPWIAEMWFAELGADQARGLLAAINQPAESALRVNTLVATVVEVTSALPVGAHPAAEIPEGLVLEGPFDVHGSGLFGGGAVIPQARASMLVARVLAPEPGERILDLCAAPGGKTTHLAALMGDHGKIRAIERHSGRAQALRETCRRARTTCVTVETADASQVRPEPAYDRVLVDPPCTGLGTLQSRPDRRWRAGPESPDELAKLQGRILAAAGAATAPGGTVVYSVCTISSRESEAVVEEFLADHPQFVADDLQAEYPQWRHPRSDRFLQLLPHRDGTDGFFISRLRRR
jgi:16S rRNA (cytosine967-C5)-methyltransferase